MSYYSNTSEDINFGWTCYFVDASSGSLTYNLGTYTYDGNIIYIKRVDTSSANTVSIVTPDSKNIDYSTSININPLQIIGIQSFNNQWWIIQNS